MKKLITILSLSLSLTSFAGVITCSNNPNSPGQYTSLQDAIDNANAGDTILVHGSGTSYGNITLNSKALTFIGAGINQPSSDISQLGRVQIYRLSASVSGSGCTFIGLNICLFDMNPTFTGGNQSSQIIENITIERCRIEGISGCTSSYYEGFTLHYGSHQYNNILVKNCIWSSSPFRMANFSSMAFTMSNFRFENNVFDGAGFWYMPGIVDLSGVSFSNNFFGSGTNNWNYQGNVAVNLNGPHFYDNIYFGANPSGLVNAVLNNNLTYNCSDDDLFTVYSNSTGGANLFGQDPLLVNYPVAGSTFNHSLDYNLSAGSPCLSSGLGGGDIGVYGGPNVIQVVGSNPAIPQMEEIVTPLGSNVSKGTNLNVTFKSYKQD